MTLASERLARGDRIAAVANLSAMKTSLPSLRHSSESAASPRNSSDTLPNTQALAEKRDCGA